MSRVVVRAAKATLVFGCILTLVVQLLFIPLIAAETVRGFPEVAYLRWPGIVGCIAIVICAQVVMVCTWRLLTLVSESSIFAPESLRYVDVMVGASLAASALFAAAFVTLSAANATGGPGVAFLLIAGTGGSLGIALILSVMRSLLTQATSFKHELAEVV